MFHILLAVLGIGLVIFVHELGHFLAARLCGVRVETFSIGMGPKMLGWTRGDTTYQIAVLPLGGYVKMAGDELVDPTDPNAPAREARSDELHSKSVGQRFLIFSGGVIMNVVFGLVVFPIVFLVGVPFTAPVIGAPDVGSVAWHAGLEAGTEIVAVNDIEVHWFDNIPTAIALAERGGLDLTVRAPGASETSVVRVVPQTDEAIGVPMIGIRPDFEPGMPIVLTPGSPAAEAGVLDGDHLLAVRDGLPGLNPLVNILYQQDRGRDIELQVATPGEAPRWVKIAAPMVATEEAAFGFNALLRVVSDLRTDSPVASFGLRKGDRLVSLGGHPIARSFDLREALFQALGTPAVLVVERGGALVQLELGSFDEARIASFCNDVAIRADTDSAELFVYEGGPAWAAGLRTGDRISRIDGAPVESYEDIAAAGRAGSEDKRALVFSVLRQEVTGGPLVSLDLRVTPAVLELPGELGINFRPHGMIYRAEGPLHALQIGTESTWRFLADAWVFLKRIVSQDVSAKNAGGIITIGMVSSHWASEGLAKLFFFLCILSMNLAFLNILPVPLLDGGHLFFLLVEKLKGSPVSIRIQVMSQAIGLVMLLTLMIYVTYNDVVRWFFP
ncbi:MAG: RIP metalloprotease RseP [Planctomycetota bacterium]|nr:RIP metalloprotease RseP [Planctomycetota bacterium]